MDGTPGTLYLCATPIGNLEDVTFRVLRILGEVDLVAAEDTRRARKLLSYYDIHNNITSYYEHNHAKKSVYILDMLEKGNSVALVSDAGMPGISDPGEELVQEALCRGMNVVPLPGPNAALAALSVSGLPARAFIFEGFLPHARKDKRKILQNLAAEKRTIIFHESPYRIRETLAEMQRCLGNRRIAVARELTKKFEEVIRGSVSEIVEHFVHSEPRGEFTLVVEGAGKEQPGPAEVDQRISPAEHVFQLESQGVHRKEAIKKVARLRGLPKRAVYDEVINKKNN